MAESNLRFIDVIAGYELRGTAVQGAEVRDSAQPLA